MGLFGDRGLRNLRKEAAAFRKLVEGVAGTSQEPAAESSAPIGGEDIARMTAGALRESLQKQAARGREADAMECVLDVFRGADFKILATADEMLGVAEPFLSAGVDSP